MLIIPCPWCGDRDESEFKYGGEAHIERPLDPDALTDEAWADFLFMRRNTKGPFLERWMHAAGCRRWFNLARDTATNQVFGAYRIGERAPAAYWDAVGQPAEKNGKTPPGWRVVTGGAAEATPAAEVALAARKVSA